MTTKPTAAGELPEHYYHRCCTPGLAGTTEVVCMQHADGTWECRIGIALFGSTNMDEAGFKAADHNPFHNLFYDNYAVGKGPSKMEAISALEKDWKDLHNSLWTF